MSAKLERTPGLVVPSLKDQLQRAQHAEVESADLIKEANEAIREKLLAMWEASQATIGGLREVDVVTEDVYNNAFRVEDPRFFTGIRDERDPRIRILDAIGEGGMNHYGAYITIHSDFFDPDDPRDTAEKLFVSVQTRNHVGSGRRRGPEDYVPDIGVAFHQNPTVWHSADFRQYFSGPPQKAVKIKELNGRDFSPLEVTRAMLYTVLRLGDKIPGAHAVNSPAKSV